MNAAFVSSEVNIKAMANNSNNNLPLDAESMSFENNPSNNQTVDFNLAIVPASSSAAYTDTSSSSTTTGLIDSSALFNRNNSEIEKTIELDDLKNVDHERVAIENELNVNNERAVFYQRIPNQIGSFNAPKIEIILNNEYTNQKHETSNQSSDGNLLSVMAKPSDNSMHNSSSQSSIDTRIKFGEENVDMIPLMPISNHNNNNGQRQTPSGLVDDKKVEIDYNLNERWYTIFIQVLLPFLIAGFGMVAAGVVLDIVQHWELYLNIEAIFTLIPALLGLKGNLEMTLASRFSTQVNLGRIFDRSTIMSAVLGNFALTQCQAIIVGFLASVGALMLKLISDGKFDLNNSLVLIAGSVSTASFASLVLAGLMMFVIILSKRFHLNPDNIATPIAASLGDLVTLSILSLLCTWLYQIRTLVSIPIVIISLYLIMVPVFVYYSYSNDFVKEALYHGWTPIILAMIISSSGGFIMGFAVKRYEDIAVFQPVVNGIGGNLVAIFASRLSTALHRTGVQGTKASWAPTKWYMYPMHTFFGKSNPESKTALVLAMLGIPGHSLFFYTIKKIKALQGDDMNQALLHPSFIIFYLAITMFQILILLLICYWLVHLAWKRDKNPDNVCIPYLTAIGDLLGMAFMAFCFHVLYLAGNTKLRTH